ncbi:hypothetical protein [Actinoplanes sp. NPDC049802]|uniref:hypothetical protein n=1 Tax=Actinoplanes sp. NPDC049802 TaxID=3154742 RepID=UPI0033DEE30F
MNERETADGWQELWLGTATTRTGHTTEPAGWATSLDGSISVTVGPAGQVLGLNLDDRVRDLTGRQLAREIMMVMRRAHAHLPV